MAQKRRAAKKEPSYEESALTAKQKQIAVEQAQLEAKMAEYKKIIEEAPKLAADRARRARDQFVIRASRTEHRGGNRAALPAHRRYDLDPGAPARQKRLRAERNKGRFMFFVLLLVLGSVMAWLYFSVLQHS